MIVCVYIGIATILVGVALVCICLVLYPLSVCGLFWLFGFAAICLYLFKCLLFKLIVALLVLEFVASLASDCLLARDPD